jgi:hypothetical protein
MRRAFSLVKPGHFFPLRFLIDGIFTSFGAKLRRASEFRDPARYFTKQNGPLLPGVSAAPTGEPDLRARSA